jgi:hypothetical protein
MGRRGQGQESEKKLGRTIAGQIKGEMKKRKWQEEGKQRKGMKDKRHITRIQCVQIYQSAYSRLIILMQ